MTKVVTLILCLLAIGCIPGNRKRLVEGTWKKETKIHTVLLELKSNDSLMITFDKENMRFRGSYKIAKNVIEFSDVYCGKKLPGKYKYSLTKGKLNLEIVDDKQCTRNIMYPGQWERIN